MRTMLLVTTGVAMLGFAGAASAQSGQGGYLGKNPGGALTAQRPASAPGPSSAPTAWCDGFSLVPGRCRNRAAADHAWCAARQPDHYAECRRTLDYMGWPP